MAPRLELRGIFSWKIVLGYEGVINTSLLELGWIDAPLEVLLYRRTAVFVALVHAWAPFAMLPIYVSLEKIDRSAREAAVDLGDSAVARFLRVTLPLSSPGIFAASVMIFIPTLGDYVTPALLGGLDGMMIGNIVHAQLRTAHIWPMGAAFSIVLALWIVAIVTGFLWLIRKTKNRSHEERVDRTQLASSNLCRAFFDFPRWADPVDPDVQRQ